MKWNLEKRAIKDLRNHPKNPRRLKKEQRNHLSKSLEKFGQCEPIVINPDGTIIGGHQRVKVMKTQGAKEVDVYVPENPLSNQDVEELNIRLNKNVGEWDDDILADEWDVFDLLEWGFTEEELQIDKEFLEGGEEADDEVSEPPKEPKTKPGDIYDLGDHRLVCGDCTDALVVEKLLNGEEPVLMVTDPPYGVNYEASWRPETKGKTSKGVVINDHNNNWLEAWKLFPGNIAYIWHSGKKSNVLIDELEECNFEIKSQIIWNKHVHSISRGNYHWKHEPCFYAVKKGKSHNWQGSKKENTVWDINSATLGGMKKEGFKSGHSTQKPLECMARPIRNNSAKGESVYDPFSGSGTTLLACEGLSRKCFALELSPKYCDVIVDRWVRHRNKNNEHAPVIRNGEEIEWDKGDKYETY